MDTAHPSGDSAMDRLSRIGAHGVDPAVEIRLGPALLPPIPLLERADHFVAVPLGTIPVVVGELAPHTLGFALELLPASFEDVSGRGHDVSFQWFVLDRPLAPIVAKVRSKEHAAWQRELGPSSATDDNGACHLRAWWEQRGDP